MQAQAGKIRPVLLRRSTIEHMVDRSLVYHVSKTCENHVYLQRHQLPIHLSETLWPSHCRRFMNEGTATQDEFRIRHF